MPAIRTHTINGHPFEMLPIPGGVFQMGDERGDLWDACRPVHELRVGDFYLGKYPVTQALWKAVMRGENPSVFQGENRPVEMVSWDDICEKFLPELNRLLPGFGFRLPTEAEWEYAARGGEGRGGAYAGSDRLGEVGWYAENSHRETKPVGLKYPNALGLYDMCGNVWEWCEDDWLGNYKNAPEDGSAWIGRPERGVYRVLRGGSYWRYPQNCRVAYRYNYRPADRFDFIGFRLAASFQSVD